MRNAILGLAAVALIALTAGNVRAEHNYGSDSRPGASIHTVAHGYGDYHGRGHHGAYSSHGRSTYYPRYHGRYPAVPSHPQVIVPYHGHPPVVLPPVYRGYNHGCSPHRYPNNNLYYRGSGFGFSFSF